MSDFTHNEPSVPSHLGLVNGDFSFGAGKLFLIVTRKMTLG